MTVSAQLKFEILRKSEGILVVFATNWRVFIFLDNIETSFMCRNQHVLFKNLFPQEEIVNCREVLTLGWKQEWCP